MQTIPIALCFNNNFCQLAAGALQSIINQSTSKYQYDIYIIHSDISDQNKHLLQKINNKENISVKFMYFDVKAMAESELYVRGHFTREMYTRLFLHKIFPHVEKILYTDVDIIVNSDLADLYNTDIGNYPIAAALNHHVQDGNIDKLKTITWVKNFEERFRKYENLYQYLIDYLKFTDNDLNTYFATGTMIFDLRKAGKIIDDGLPGLIDKEYLLPDMDIFNSLFKNNIFVLDKSYCIVPNDLFRYVSEHGRLPDIIHYIGSNKPNRTMSRFGDAEYWKSLSQTDLYYPVLESFISDKISKAVNRSYFDNLGRLCIDLKRINRIKRRQRLIRAMLKPILSAKKYKKLKDRPESFFNDSKSGFIRYLKKFYF